MVIEGKIQLKDKITLEIQTLYFLIKNTLEYNSDIIVLYLLLVQIFELYAR